MAEAFFTKIASDVLDATEKISKDFDDGIAALFGSEPQDTAPPETASPEDDIEIEEEFMHSPLQGMAESVMGDILAGQQGPQGPIEHFHAFRHAITWTEPFICGLVTFQILMFGLSVYISRQNQSLGPRVGIMLFIFALVRGAERINAWGARHWSSFATQNYFDAKGIFILIMFCGPLLMDCLIMLLIYLREASQLLVQVKAAQIQKKQQQQQQQGGNEKKRRSKKDQ